MRVAPSGSTAFRFERALAPDWVECIRIRYSRVLRGANAPKTRLFPCNISPYSNHQLDWVCALLLMTVQGNRAANLFKSRGISTLVFDVDGTLYRQRPVRWRMLARLLSRAAFRPGEMVPAVRALRSYRRAQEEMRDSHTEYANLADE